MNLFELFAKLSLDSSEYEKGLSDAEKRASSFSKSGLAKMTEYAKTGARAIAAVGTTAVGAGAGLFKLVSSVASTGDNIDKMSQKLGMSAKAYQEWDFIMRHCGTTITSMTSSMKTLANAAESGNEAFEELGMTQEQIASMSQEELFGATIRGLQNVKDSTRRTYLASKLLGRGATELGALLNMTAKETDDMRKSVHELGGVMSDDAVKASAAYQDSLQDMQDAAKGLMRGAVSKAIPSVSSAIKSLTRVISGPQGKALQTQIGKIIQTVANAVKNAIPRLLSLLDNGAKKIKIFAAALSVLVLAVKATTNPIGALVTGLGMLVGSLAVAKLTADDARKKFGGLTDAERDMTDAANDQAEAVADAGKARVESFATIDDETKRVQNLWAELKTLVDENGNVTEGYEDRVDYINGELAKAIGTEMQLNDGILEGYKEQAEAIDNLIKKRQAERLLAANEESVRAAEETIKANADAIEARKRELENFKTSLTDAQNHFNDVQEAIDRAWTRGQTARAGLLELEKLATEKNINEINENITQAEADIQRWANEVVDAHHEIALNERATVEFEKGNFAIVRSLFEDDIVNRWKVKAERGRITQAELAELKRQANVAAQAAAAYLEQLKAGNEDYNRETYEKMSQNAANLLEIWANAATEAFKAGRDVGENVGAGIEKGINDKLKAVIGAAQGMVGKTFSAMKAVAQIASPSKVARKIGENIGGSVGIGIHDSYADTIKQADNLTYGVLGALDKTSGATVSGGGATGAQNDVVQLLREIRDNLGFDVVLSDGTIAGRIDKLLGQTALRKIRGNA